MEVLNYMLFIIHFTRYGIVTLFFWAGSPEPSHALLSMGLTDEEAHCALRFSLGLENTKDEIERTLTLLGEVVKESKTIVRFVPCR